MGLWGQGEKKEDMGESVVHGYNRRNDCGVISSYLLPEKMRLTNNDTGYESETRLLFFFFFFFLFIRHNPRLSSSSPSSSSSGSPWRVVLQRCSITSRCSLLSHSSPLLNLPSVAPNSTPPFRYPFTLVMHCLILKSKTLLKRFLLITRVLV